MNGMKKYVFFATLMVALVMTCCKETPYINAPGDNSKNYDSIPVWIPDTNGIVISVDSAIVIGSGQGQDVPTEEVYKISGTITSVETNIADIPSKYTNINFYISDGGSGQLKCQYTNNVNNTPFRKSSQVPRAGSKVTVLGPLSKYNGAPQMKNGFIVRIDKFVGE